MLEKYLDLSLSLKIAPRKSLFDEISKVAATARTCTTFSFILTLTLFPCGVFCLEKKIEFLNNQQ